MINKIAFTGREAMLTKGLSEVINNAQVIKASSILPELKTNIVMSKPVKAEYSSPFAPIVSGIKKEVEMPKITGLDIFG